jgi:hypothetical protein
MTWRLPDRVTGHLPDSASPVAKCLELDGATWYSLSLLESPNTSFLLAFDEVYLEVWILKDFKLQPPKNLPPETRKARFANGAAIRPQGSGDSALRYRTTRLR